MKSAYRFLVIVALACSAVLATPDGSAAQLEEDGYGAVAVLVLGAGVVIPIPFLVAELVYAVKESWLPLGWAVVQLMAGAVELFGAGWLMHDMATFERHVDSGFWNMTLALTVVGSWLVADSILSLLLYERPEPPELEFRMARPTAVS